MRPEAFTSTERGRVRKTQEGFLAFFPAGTPRRLSLSDDVVKLLDEATGAVHRLGGVGRLIPNPHLLIGPRLRLEAVLSSRIEGTKTDVGQLLRFEAGQVTSGEARDDAVEVQNYVVALEHGLERIRGGFPISTRLLREMHERLLSGAPAGSIDDRGSCAPAPSGSAAVRPAMLSSFHHLLATSQRGDLMPWIAFFLRGVQQQAKDSEERTVRLVELQHQLRNDLLDEGRSNSVVRLAEQLFAVPLVTAAPVEKMIGVSRPTAQLAIDTLVERGDLAEVTGRSRFRIYEAPAIFDVVYGPVSPHEPTSHPELPFA